MLNHISRRSCWYGAAVLAAALTAGSAALAQNDIVIGATQPGSQFNIIATALTDVISKETDFTGRLVTSAGPSQWLPMTDTGEVDLGIMSHYETWQALTGDAPFPKTFDVRLLAAGEGVYVGLYVPKNSAVQSMADVRGLRIANDYPGNPAINVFVQGELANAGLTFDDVRPQPRTTLYGGQREDVTEGRLDVFYASLGSGLINELDSTLGVRFLGLDPSPEAVARMREVYPAVVVPVAAGPAGVEKDIHLAYIPTYVLGHANVGEEAVHAALEGLWNRNDEFRATNPSLGGWLTDGFATTDAIVPYHEHAVSFYRAKGVWTEEMDARQAELLAEFSLQR